jgi:hypothetical protein
VPGKRHARQPAVAGRGEQAQRIPSRPPGVADTVVLVEDHERSTPLTKVIADSETGLSTTDDHSLDVTGAHLNSPVIP